MYMKKFSPILFVLFLVIVSLPWIQCAPLEESKFDLSQVGLSSHSPLEVHLASNPMEMKEFKVIETFFLAPDDIKKLLEDGKLVVTNIDVDGSEKRDSDTVGRDILVLSIPNSFQKYPGDLKIGLSATRSAGSDRSQLTLTASEDNFLHSILSNADLVIEAHVIRVQDG